MCFRLLKPVRLAGVLLACVTAALWGCLTPFDLAANAGLGVAQAGTSSFIQGTLTAAFGEPMVKIADASRRALVRLGYEITREDSGTFYMVIQGDQSDGSDIVVKLRESSPTVTGLSIRVGLWGDNAVSRLILAEIEKELAVPSGSASSRSRPDSYDRCRLAAGGRHR